MLRWAPVFLVAAPIAAALGGIGVVPVDVARTLSSVFLMLLVASLIVGLRSRPPV